MLSISPFLVIDDNITSSMFVKGMGEVFNILGSYKHVTIRTRG